MSLLVNVERGAVFLKPQENVLDQPQYLQCKMVVMTLYRKERATKCRARKYYSWRRIYSEFPPVEVFKTDRQLQANFVYSVSTCSALSAPAALWATGGLQQPMQNEALQLTGAT